MQDEQQPGWVFKPGDNTAQPARVPQEQPQSQERPQPILPPQPEPVPMQTDNEAPQVAWTASEYQDNPKSAGWFALLAIASILSAAVFYILTEDLIPTLVIAIVGIMVGVFAARKPRVLQYALDRSGVHIGEKLYAYETFKSFSVGTDQAMSYIQLMPLRRFMPPIIIHYDPADEDKIADTLSSYLPFEEHKRDMADRIARRIRL